MTDSLDRVATLLAAASAAPDRGVRLAYLGEARAVLMRAIERQRELALLLERLEGEIARATQMELTP